MEKKLECCETCAIAFHDLVLDYVESDLVISFLQESQRPANVRGL